MAIHDPDHCAPESPTSRTTIQVWSTRSSCRKPSARQLTAARDTLNFLPGLGAIKPMPKTEIAKAVQLLDIMVEIFADDGHWIRGGYDDGNGGHCLVGALLHLGRKHGLPTAPAIALLQDAMPRPGLPLVHFKTGAAGALPSCAPSFSRPAASRMTMRSERGRPPRPKPGCLLRSRTNDPRARRISRPRPRTSRSPPNVSPPPSERPQQPRSGGQFKRNLTRAKFLEPAPRLRPGIRLQVREKPENRHAGKLGPGSTMLTMRWVARITARSHPLDERGNRLSRRGRGRACK
jgi:hypothetical protein